MNTPAETNTMPALAPEELLEQLNLIAHKALNHWQIRAQSLALIKHRENAVYRVESRCGKRYALRIHRPGYHSDAALRSELQWMSALADDGVQVPEVIPTPDGRLMVRETTALLQTPHQIDLFAWINGEPLGSVEQGLSQSSEEVNRIYQAIGETAARLHNQAVNWPLPDGFQRHAWDTEGLVGETPFWGQFWQLESLTSAQRELLLQARNRIRSELENYDRSPTRYGLIHADFVPENLMVENGQPRLIDFDDAGFGWHLFELATALYFIRDEPHYDTARTALIAGYRKHRPLENSELEWLELFLTARGFTYLGWVRDRQETETARELAPELIRRACEQAERYLCRISE